MTTAPAGSLLEFLRQVPDTRGRQGQPHALSATLAAVVCAVLCGARSYEALAQWLHLQDVSTWHWLGFWRTPPKKTGIRSILLSVDPQALEAVVRCWLAETLDVELDEQNLQPVSIDGKTVRGSLQQHERATHEVAYALTSALRNWLPRRNCCSGGESTGTSRTVCIGSGTPRWERTPARSARDPPLRSWPPSATWP